MNNKMITILYADAIEYGENTSALFKALWELTDLIRLESELKKHQDVYKRQCLCEALEVLTAWGFSYKTVAFVWVKQNRRNDDLFTGMGSVSYTHL